MALPQNTGSFGAATGGGSALAEAMQRRGMDTSILQQITPGGGGGDTPMPQNPGDLQSAQAALPNESVQASPEPQTASQTPQPAPPTDPELMVAMEALGGFVRQAGNTRRDVVKAKSQGIV